MRMHVRRMIFCSRFRNSSRKHAIISRHGQFTLNTACGLTHAHSLVHQHVGTPPATHGNTMTSVPKHFSGLPAQEETRLKLKRHSAQVARFSRSCRQRFFRRKSCQQK